MPELEQKPQKRQVAVKVNVKDIVNGNYIKEEGWQPNYIAMEDGRRVARVNIIGVVVFGSDEKDFNYSNFVIDDGSGKISVRSFEKNDMGNVDVGDIILIIGRPREYNNEMYILPEIIRKIPDVNWIKLRKLELSKVSDIKPIMKVINEDKKYEIVHEGADKNDSDSKIIYDFIKKMDQGDGVLIDDVIKKSNSERAEKITRNLLESGDIFEVKPGIIKVLE
jgi:RPA family protein